MKVFLQQLTVLLAIALFVPSICAQGHTLLAADVAQLRFNASSFMRTELFFGRSRTSGSEISDEEFADFLDDTVTPAFPDGLTVLDGLGQFRDREGKIIQEKAKVLILIYRKSERKNYGRRIEQIRDAYKKRFDQQSVLRIDSTLPGVSF